MTIDRLAPMPPRWADALLRALLKPGDRDSVSGDLLEEYRDTIVPARGKGANAWYIRQVARHVWRAAWLWAVLLTIAVLGRDVLDWWLAPTQDYYARSVVSTWTAVALFAASGGWTSLRTRSVRASVVAGIATGAVAAILTVAASLAELAVRHDPHTMRMIAASGGLDEVFLLPFVHLVPGTLVAITAGAIAKGFASLVRPRLDASR